jgi:hypothetical protein
MSNENPELRQAVWTAMLDADMNARYWKYLVGRYRDRDTILKIFVAVTTSGTVAAWGVWQDLEWVWKILSGISAVFAISMPILGYPKLIETMSELAGKWGELRIEYEDMYLIVNGQTHDAKAMLNSYRKLRNATKELEYKETKTSLDKKLVKKCYEEVKHSRRLS